MKIKTLLSAMMILCLGITSIQVVNAEDIAEETPENIRDYINENAVWGKVKTNGSIPVGNKEISLLVTFESQNDALLKFKQTYQSELALIQEDEKLETLSNENYSVYYDILNSNGTKYFSVDDLNLAYSFFDLYENNDHNEVMKNSAMKLNFRTSLEDRNDLLEQIDALSPLYNERVIQTISPKYVIHLSQINVSQATAYAKKHAKPNTYNRNYKYYENKDCTNFASQIAYAAGLRQGTSWKPYSGAWTVANSFAALWGKKGKATKWSTFVKTLKPGNFIGLDKGADGSIDHIGYITANGSNASRKWIAQHSSDYHTESQNTAWDSDAPGKYLWIIGNP